MNLSKETIATIGIIAVMIIPLYYQMWDIKDSISELTERVTRLEVGQQVLATEIKINRLHNAHHRHHADGEVYYERGIVRGTGASNTPGTSPRDIASAGNEAETTSRQGDATARQ